MTTQNIKVELFINGKKAVIGHQYLEDTVSDIPDIKENQEIFDALIHSDNPEVQEHIANVEHLSKKSIDILLNDDNIDVVDNVLSNVNLAKYIKHETLMKIVQSNNTKFLVSIAENIDDYAKCDLCQIVKILANHKNVSVRYALVHWRASDIVTVKILKQLVKDGDIDVSNNAREELERRG